MSGAAPYPDSDYDEVEAIRVFENLLDFRYIKSSITKRDKVPNVDGFIEILDYTNSPIAKVEVQVRKIPVNRKQYSVQKSLVLYSKNSSTLPVILICVDIINHKVYWKHIHSLMSEYKEGQNTFTVYFDDSTDIVNTSGEYIQRWIQIAKDYQIRINEFPVAAIALKKEKELLKLTRDEQMYFQDYLDAINNFVRSDFEIIKDLSNIWMFGIVIYSIDDDRIIYGIGRIPYGDTKSPIYFVGGNPFNDGLASNVDIEVEFATILDRSNLGNSREKGKQFVLNRVNRLVKEFGFPVFGEILASDIIFSFIDNYYRFLYLDENKNDFDLDEISNAFYNTLTNTCKIYLQKQQDKLLLVDLDNMKSSYFPPKKPKHTLDPKLFWIRSRKFPLDVVESAIQYLRSVNLINVKRPFVKRARIDGFIWTGYSLSERGDNIKKILSNCITEYKIFCQGCKFNFTDSYYLSDKYSIIYGYSNKNEKERPLVEEMVVINHDKMLPKVIVEEGLNTFFNGRGIMYNDVWYNSITISASASNFLFHDQAMRNMIYNLLINDMKRHYNLTNNIHFML
ncbi:hypothetical protein [Herpetosiphon gulosus]|uniref:DUF4365 domain-containing protein n=1 Tax=Herpetosiphon gulosus TaxID=1973496 RepID=A0ABP9XAN6_9CHLR